MGNKNKVTVKCLFGIFANCHFIFRFQVKLVLRAFISKNFLSLQQGDTRNFLNHRNISFQKFQFIRIMLFQIFHHITQAGSFHCHYIVHTVDIAHLKVQTDVLVDMTGSCVLFCTIYRSNLKNTIEECHSSLLIELRRLV